MPPEAIELVTPSGAGWAPVSRMVLGGIAARLDLGLEDLDDLQLAVERVLAEADGSEQSVRLRFEFRDDRVTARIGPLRLAVVADDAVGEDAGPPDLTLARVLRTVLDSYAIEPTDDQRVFLRLEKSISRPPASP